MVSRLHRKFVGPATKNERTFTCVLNSSRVSVLAPAVRNRTRFQQDSKGPNDIQAQSRTLETRSLVVTREVGGVYHVFSMENREGNSELRTTTRWCSFESV